MDPLNIAKRFSFLIFDGSKPFITPNITDDES